MANPNLLGTIYKTTAETFDCSVGFSSWITTGDTVASGTVTCWQGTTNVSSTMVASVTDDNDDEVAWTLLAAGTAGTMYLLKVTATTAAGDIWAAWLYLKVS